MAWIPVPDSAALTVPAPVANDNVPVRAAAAVGVSCTVVAQVAPAASEVPQVVETKLKSVPVTEAAVGAVSEMGARPVLVRVELLEPELPTTTLPKATAASVALGAWPVPVRLTLAIPPPLCVKLSVPVRAPEVDGVKVTLTVHVPLTATEPQLFDCAKSVEPVEMPTPVKVSVFVPEFVTVMVCTADVVAVCCAENVREPGDTEA